MIDIIREKERTLKRITAEYQKEKERLNFEILDATRKLANNIAKNFSSKYNIPCSARLNLDGKLLVIYIDDKDDLWDTFTAGEWLVRIKAEFCPKEKFQEGEIAEWFNAISAYYLTQAGCDASC